MSTENQVSNEELLKSMDSLIDEFFMEDAPETSEEETVEKSEETAVEDATEEETVEKSKDAIHEIIDEKPKAAKADSPNNKSATTADEDLDSGEKVEEDDEAGKKRGRSKDISSWEDRGKDGDTSNRQYDRDITSPAQDPSKPEDSQVQAPAHISKSEEDTVTISKEEYELFKKSLEEKAAKEQEEALQKAKQEQTDLIKSAVSEATADLREKLEKANATIEKLAAKPKQRQSIESVVALEKGGYAPDAQSGKVETFSKSEILDAAQALFEEGKLNRIEDIIEIETTGVSNNPEVRRLVENKLRNR